MTAATIDSYQSRQSRFCFLGHHITCKRLRPNRYSSRIHTREELDVARRCEINYFHVSFFPRASPLCSWRGWGAPVLELI